MASVPKWIKCLVVGDTKVNLLLSGLLVVSKLVVSCDALVDNLAAIPAFHVNVLPLAMVATKTSPKLLNDQSPGSRVVVVATTGSP